MEKLNHWDELSIVQLSFHQLDIIRSVKEQINQNKKLIIALQK